MKKTICYVLIIGAAWGITEATVGHFLHLFTLRIGYLFWFPIAFFFLNAIYRITKSTYCMLFSALLAASIKLIDLNFTPRIDYVINPAVSIVLEAISAFFVFRYYKQKENSVPIHWGSLLSTGLAWKSLYICYLFLLPKSFIELSCLKDMTSFAKFLFFETFLNTVLLYSFYYIFNFLKSAYQTTTKIKLHIASVRQYDTGLLLPISSVVMLFLAVLIQIKL